ncbi:hypothetical protein Tco_0702167 [Tanacetum coccineum]|uniref:Enkurin domain-containing protein n=1 Tax=Tanacetum coccineum TaxID=301880 RepID=A0ABQ4XVV5_9ASTR
MLAPQMAQRIREMQPSYGYPKYLKIAQSEKASFCMISNDTSDPVKLVFAPTGKGSLTLEKESRIKNWIKTKNLPQIRKQAVQNTNVIAPGPSRNCPKHVSHQSPREKVGSNDMVHNYYLEKAKKSAQLQKDKEVNGKPSMIDPARLPADMSKRIRELERDNMRLRDMMDVASQRVAWSQRKELRVQREMRQIWRFKIYDCIRIARLEAYAMRRLGYRS